MSDRAEVAARDLLASILPMWHPRDVLTTIASCLRAYVEEARREEQELVGLIKIMSHKADWPEVLWYDGYLCRSDAMQFGELLTAIRAREEKGT